MASNHFRKSFSIKPCVWLHMENKIFRICISFDRKKKPLTRKLFYFSIFTLNHFRTELQMRKERERERERNGEQEQTELQFDDHKLSSSPTTHTALTALVSSITAPRRSSKDRFQRHAISPSPPPRDLASRSNPVASLSSFSQFDRI